MEILWFKPLFACTSKSVRNLVLVVIFHGLHNQMLFSKITSIVPGCILLLRACKILSVKSKEVLSVERSSNFQIVHLQGDVQDYDIIYVYFFFQCSLVIIFQKHISLTQTLTRYDLGALLFVNVQFNIFLLLK